jgi:hypothetical protein
METFDSSRFYFQDLDKGIGRTPDFLAQEMILKIPEYIFESSTTTFLDPACGRGTFHKTIAKKLKGYGHSWENITSRIFGIDIDPFSGIKQAHYFFGPKNIIVQDFLEMSFPDNWPKRFDVIISNPPYSKGLHLKFLEKSLTLSKKDILFVHPSTQYVDKKSDMEGEKSKYYSINQKLEKFIKSIHLFNGNSIFNIGLYIPCAITHLDVSNKNNGNFYLTNQITNEKKICNSVSNIHSFGTSDLFFSIFSKIRMRMENSLNDLANLKCQGKENERILKDPNSFFVDFTFIRGHSDLSGSLKTMFKEDFHTLFKKSIKPKFGENPKYGIWFEFKTMKEAENFISYCKTDFARFGLAILKMSQNQHAGEMKLIPWMDFTQEWDEEKLYSHFGITKEEQAFIKKIIPPFYDTGGEETE